VGHGVAEVEFFFDCSCPWTYLAFTRLREVARRTGSTIVWRPIVVRDVLQTANLDLRQGSSMTGCRQARYESKDLADWADFCNLKIELPPDWPPKSDLAMRGATLALEAGRIEKYCEHVFRACFEYGRDISTMSVLNQVVIAAGMDESGFRKNVAANAATSGLTANAGELIERGGFGSPTMFVGESMFFGNDRMPLVEFALGQASGRQFVPPGDHGAN
jgi:2-hydroxychromene-2-carboxylate isomerase